MAEERVFSVLVENIDGDQVVLELDSAVTIRFPTTHLPEGIREGDVLKFRISPDPEEAERRRNRIRNLRRELENLPD